MAGFVTSQFGETAQIAGLVFVVVFALNVLPAFAPPTWMTMSFIGLAVPSVNFAGLALIGSIAATMGRTTLAKCSRIIVRERLLSNRVRHNIDVIKAGIERRPVMTFSTFFGYALSPLPSNYLFIAYGLTSLPMRLVILPFFIGRFLSYAFWAASAAMVGKRLDLDWFESTPYFVAYFLLSQLMLVPAIYVFARLDWRLLLTERRFAWLKNSDGNAN